MSKCLEILSHLMIVDHLMILDHLMSKLPPRDVMGPRCSVVPVKPQGCCERYSSSVPSTTFDVSHCVQMFLSTAARTRAHAHTHGSCTLSPVQFIIAQQGEAVYR